MKCKFDTHIHTAETSSCASIDAESIVKLYHRSGLDGIVITDHYFKEYFDSLSPLSWTDKVNAFIKGYKVAAKQGGKLNFKVFLGMELRFSGCINDYLIYGISEDFLFENPNLYELTIKDFKSLVFNENIMIFQAHPFRCDFRMNVANFPEKPKYLDGVEVLNGNSSNDKAFDFAVKNGLKMIAGSDVHNIDDLARTGIAFKNSINNYSEFIFSLQNGLYKIIER